MAGLIYGYTYMKRGKDALNPGASNMRPVKVVNATTLEIVGEYDSIKDASDKLGVPHQSILVCCKRNRNTDDYTVYQKRNLIFTYNDKPVF